MFSRLSAASRALRRPLRNFALFDHSALHRISRAFRWQANAGSRAQNLHKSCLPAATRLLEGHIIYLCSVSSSPILRTRTAQPSIIHRQARLVRDRPSRSQPWAEAEKVPSFFRAVARIQSSSLLVPARPPIIRSLPSNHQSLAQHPRWFVPIRLHPAP